ncbi:MAG: LLM class flavin-dependent oxidoreductase [Azospirillaceae bacterium]|nr:LLM class flavin-dependent oxidoreductase [Azospirillaceae bacterium]
MTVEFYWRLPLHGCHGNLAKTANRGDWTPLRAGNIAPGLRDGEPDGIPFINHAAEIAKAAEISGFSGALVISFPQTEEAWAVSAALARETKTLNFLIAFQPNFIHPVHAAQKAASLQRATGGRVEWNIITGGGGPSQRWYGDYLPHADRYNRTREFLEVVKAEFKGEPYDFNGKIFQVEGGGLQAPHSLEKLPKLFLSGSSDNATAVAADHADLQLNWLEPIEQVRENILKIQERSAAAGRKAGYALRIEILARRTEEQAWREVARAWERLTPEDIEARFAAGPAESVGAARQRSFRPDGARHWQDLKVGPARWGGFNLLRGGPGVGLVGSYQQVAEQLNELIDLGVTSFILAGSPHLEESYRVGEEILPLLRQRPAAANRHAAE